MNNEKIKVKSTVNGLISIKLPELRVAKTWARKGAVNYFTKEQLDEAMFDPGSKFMFDMGILFIEDMDFKKELGIEPEEAEEPTNIIDLTESKIKMYLTAMSFDEFKVTFAKLTSVQKEEVANYAIDNKILNSMDKLEYIKKLTNIDILQGIQFRQSLEKEV